MPRNTILNLPNILTFLRVVATPWVVYLLYGEHTEQDNFWAAILFGIAFWTDFFDGLLARRTHTITRLGKIMDPMADKLLVIGALLMLVHLQFLDVLVAILLIGREVAVSALRTLAGTEGIMIASSLSGRVKVFVEGFGIAFLILGPNFEFLGIPWMEMGYVCIYSALGLALWSAVFYFRDYSQAPSGSHTFS